MLEVNLWNFVGQRLTRTERKGSLCSGVMKATS